MIARRYRVEGRVQGVGYRAFTVRLARTLGLRGGVRNEADGSVIAVASGEPAALEEFRAGLARGPSFARVGSVQESDAVEKEGEREQFDVGF